jgi:hypothetical protein
VIRVVGVDAKQNEYVHEAHSFLDVLTAVTDLARVGRVRIGDKPGVFVEVLDGPHIHVTPVREHGRSESAKFAADLAAIGAKLDGGKISRL